MKLTTSILRMIILLFLHIQMPWVEDCATPILNSSGHDPIVLRFSLNWLRTPAVSTPPIDMT